MQKKCKSRSRRIQLERNLLALAIAQGVATAATGANIMVDDAGDSGGAGCTLRDAIASANGNTAVAGCLTGSGDDTIQFDPQIVPGTITLTNGQLDVTSKLEIQGPGADLLTISGNGNSRIFAIAAPAGDATIDGVTLTAGSADLGGAINNEHRLSLIDSVVSESQATMHGGGIASSGVTLTVINSTLARNTATMYGGGVYNSGEVTINHSTVSGNIASRGGGLYGASDILRLNNATVSDNTATGFGGGIRVPFAGTLSMTATLVANSTNGDCFNQGMLLDNTANLVETDGCGNSASGDPMLGPLADNGGPTPTHALLPGSIAIDPSVFAACTSTDQRGAFRPADGDGDGDARCDTGAFEYLPPLVVDTTALVVADGDCALPEAIDNANDDALTHDDCPPGFEADTITFDPAILPSTITLAGELSIESALTIQGPGADELTVSGDGASRIFRISDGSGQRQVVNLSGLTLTGGNVASSGGAITNSEDLTVVASTLSGNTASRGGAIGNSLSAILSLSQSTLSGNSASSEGGGLNNSGSVTVTGTTLSGNTAERGGGLFNEYAGARATLTDSTLSGNTASIEGGGVFNSNLMSTVSLINSTLSGNSAAAGGGLFNQYSVQPGTISLTNTIIADSPGGGDCDNQGTIAINFTNLIEDGSCNADFSGDPLLGLLRDNGGPTLTHLPLPGSPAIDAGDDGACTAADQRGLARPADGDDDGAAGCDIGAVEVPQPLRVTTTGVDEAGDGACSLPEAVANANDDNRLFTAAGECPAGFGPDLITFDPAILPATVTLAGPELSVSSALTIQGPGVDQLSISADFDSRIFAIDDGDAGVARPVGVFDLTLRDGVASTSGGAIFNREQLSLGGVTLIGNSAAGSGGAISNNRADLSISASTLSGNTADQDGGAISGTYTALDISASTLSGNTAGARGGAIFQYFDPPLMLRNSTLSGNSAAVGGGISFDEGGGTLINATLQGNTAGSGGGVSLKDGAFHISNTIIAGSTGGDCLDLGTIATNLNNLIEDGSCIEGAVSLLTGDPLLGPLQDNGGPTQAHALSRDSLAIDEADDGVCPADDQRGHARPADGDFDGTARCDIGAFEFDEILFANGFESLPTE